MGILCRMLGVSWHTSSAAVLEKGHVHCLCWPASSIMQRPKGQCIGQPHIGCPNGLKMPASDIDLTTSETMASAEDCLPLQKHRFSGLIRSNSGFAGECPSSLLHYNYSLKPRQPRERPPQPCLIALICKFSLQRMCTAP